MFKEKNVVNNEERVVFMGNMTKRSVQKQTQQHKTRNITKRNKTQQIFRINRVCIVWIFIRPFLL